MSKINIVIRRQRVSDAKRFYDILKNVNFKYFGSISNSVEEEREFLRKNAQKRKDNFEHNYTIIYDNKVVGAIGIKINQYRKYIGEIGYFVDEEYWGKGITTEAVKIVEKIAFNEMHLKRIEIIMNPKNKASERVAIKCGYKKEGKMSSVCYNSRSKTYDDVLMYAKVNI